MAESAIRKLENGTKISQLTPNWSMMFLCDHEEN